MKYLHTMVRVTDIDASVRFYCAALGLTEERADLSFGYVLPSQDTWTQGDQRADCVAGVGSATDFDSGFAFSSAGPPSSEQGHFHGSVSVA